MVYDLISAEYKEHSGWIAILSLRPIPEEAYSRMVVLTEHVRHEKLDRMVRVMVSTL